MAMPHGSGSRTAHEWETQLGQEIRQLRLRRNLTQAEVARRANIDRTTVVRIERGEGGSVSSLVRIARALGREEWLASFAPPEPAVSPMQLLRERQAAESGTRVRARRSSSSR